MLLQPSKGCERGEVAAQSGEAAPDSSLNPVVEPVLAGIYESALHPEHWTATLDRLVDLFDGNGAILRTSEATPESGGLWIHTRIPQWALDEYARHYHLHDLWERRAREGGLFRSGAAFTSDMLLLREEFLASAWYRGFLSRLKIRDLLVGVVHDGIRAPLPPIVISIFRGSRQPLFGEREVQLMETVVPHLARAVEINFKLAAKERHNALTNVVLEKFAPAMAFFDGSGTFLHPNPAMCALCEAGDGVCVRDGRLVAAIPAENRQLRQLIEAGGQNAHNRDSVVTISRPSGKPPYVGVSVTLRPDGIDPPDAWRPHVAVLLHDPAASAQIHLGTLIKLYGISPAEAHLVQLLVNQGSVKAIMHNTDLNEHTVRSQLKSVLRKTRTQAQGELIRLALTISVRRNP